MRIHSQNERASKEAFFYLIGVSFTIEYSDEFGGSLKMRALKLVGHIFGKLTVLEKTQKPSSVKADEEGVFWLCQCECGNKVIIPSKRLTRGLRSCGCLRTLNLVNKKFGKLTAIRVTGEKDKNGRVIWSCVCECGGGKDVAASCLVSGNVSSCGCIVGKPLNLQGRRFGKLKVIKKLSERVNRSVIWACLCDCGKPTKISTGELTCSGVESCGCLKYRTGPENPLWDGYELIGSRFWTGIKRAADKRNLVFAITIEEAWGIYERQGKRCALSGVAITFGHGDQETTASFDRIDSTKGYMTENVQWVHKDVNLMKNRLTEARFKALCLAITEHQKLKVEPMEAMETLG